MKPINFRSFQAYSVFIILFIIINTVWLIFSLISLALLGLPLLSDSPSFHQFDNILYIIIVAMPIVPTIVSSLTIYGMSNKNKKATRDYFLIALLITVSEIGVGFFYPQLIGKLF